MIGIYFLAYVGSSSVIERPLHFVAPVTVINMKSSPNAAVVKPSASLDNAANYSSLRVLLM